MNSSIPRILERLYYHISTYWLDVRVHYGWKVIVMLLLILEFWVLGSVMLSYVIFFSRGEMDRELIVGINSRKKIWEDKMES
jgi:hypothetical protein